MRIHVDCDDERDMAAKHHFTNAYVYREKKGVSFEIHYTFSIKDEFVELLPKGVTKKLKKDISRKIMRKVVKKLKKHGLSIRESGLAIDGTFYICGRTAYHSRMEVARIIAEACAAYGHVKIDVYAEGMYDTCRMRYPTVSVWVVRRVKNEREA